MKKSLLTAIVLLFSASIAMTQSTDMARRWSLGLGAKTLCGIPSAHTNADGLVAYDYGEAVLDFSLWNPTNRISLGAYLSVFGTELIPGPGETLEFCLGSQAGLGAHLHLLPNYGEGPQPWDWALNATVGAQITKFLPLDFVVGLSLSVTWYPFELWGFSLETGVNTIIGGGWEYFNPTPGQSNSILRIGVSHRF